MGGRAISDGLTPCPMMEGKAIDLESLAPDTLKLEAKLQAFDTWLWSDCEGVDQFEPMLQVDCVEAKQRCWVEDPPLFRGTALFVESDANHAHHNTVRRARLTHAAEATPAKIDAPATPSGPPRKVPLDCDTELEDRMNARADKMKEEMNMKARAEEEASRKLQEWLRSNNFFSVNSKRNRLLSSTYPLHVAAEQNNSDVIHLLLRHQANPRQLDSKRCTALQVAEKKNKQDSHRNAVTVLTMLS